jgi:hypothetical protein
MQLGSPVAKFSVHSGLSVVSAAHQCAMSQLMLSANGVSPGGWNCSSVNAAASPALA